VVVSVGTTVLLGDEDAVYQSSREDSMHPAQQGRVRAAHHLYAVIPRRMKQGATKALEMQGRKASRVWDVEKPVAEESSGHRFLEWLVRHPGCPHSGCIQSVQITGGYSSENNNLAFPILNISEYS
jgi:hypothetical protein